LGINRIIWQTYLKLAGLIAPPVPEIIRTALFRAQFESVRKQVPMLLCVAALNVVIIMAVCAHDRLPPSSYYWLGGLVLYCVVRIGMWVHRMRRPIDDAAMLRLLRMNLGATIILMTGLAVATTWTFVTGTFNSILLIPMSLGFGTLSIAHCLYTLRPAAIGAITTGLFPTSIAMILIGPFEAQMLGVAMISVGILMLRFVAEQYDQLIISLLLAEENRQLALTDSLTGLANRRAMMAALEAESGDKFAVALIDLDGFKQVNDLLGHHAGDQLLCVVADRLRLSVPGLDLVGRLGGDEFIVLFRNIIDEGDVCARADALLASLSPPVEIDGQVPAFGASLGYAVSGIHGQMVKELLRSADTALYAAKRGRKPGEPKRGSSRLAA
jgi:diguanylate cyclase